jgi:hypothetical protein
LFDGFLLAMSFSNSVMSASASFNASALRLLALVGGSGKLKLKSLFDKGV